MHALAKALPKKVMLLVAALALGLAALTNVHAAHGEPSRTAPAASRIQPGAHASRITGDPHGAAAVRAQDGEMGRDRSQSGHNPTGGRNGSEDPQVSKTPPRPDAFEVPTGSGSTATQQTNDPNNLVNTQNYPVQTAPVVHTVFWGSWGTETATYRGRLLNFYYDLGGTQYGKVLTQYRQSCYPGTATCSGANAGNPASVYGGYWYDTTAPLPSSPTQAQIAAEAVRAAKTFSDYSYNAQYVIVLPPGHFDQFSTANKACGWHQYTYVDSSHWVTYTALPYQFDTSQGVSALCAHFNNVNGYAASPYDGVSVVAGHEYAESVTDPGVLGWRDKVSGEENADKCTLVRGNVTLGRNYVYPMQATWSNAHKLSYGLGCALVW